MGAQEGDEAAVEEAGFGGVGGVFFDADEGLPVACAEGHDQEAAWAELGQQGRGHLGRAGGDEDAVEADRAGLVPVRFGPAGGAVADEVADVGDAEGGEGLRGEGGQGGEAFDGVDAAGGDEAGEEGGLVAGAGAEFEHAMVGGELEFLGHDGDHEGLGDGLAVAAGQGLVFVGVLAAGLGEEEVAGQVAHEVEDFWAGDAAGSKLSFDHVPACGLEWIIIGHGHVAPASFATVKPRWHYKPDEPRSAQSPPPFRPAFVFDRAVDRVGSAVFVASVHADEAVV